MDEDKFKIDFFYSATEAYLNRNFEVDYSCLSDEKEYLKFLNRFENTILKNMFLKKLKYLTKIFTQNTLKDNSAILKLLRRKFVELSEKINNYFKEQTAKKLVKNETSAKVKI